MPVCSQIAADSPKIEGVGPETEVREPGQALGKIKVQTPKASATTALACGAQAGVHGIMGRMGSLPFPLRVEKRGAGCLLVQGGGMHT